MLFRPRLTFPFRLVVLVIAAAILLVLTGSSGSRNSAALGQPTPQSPVPLPVPFNPIVDNANVIDPETRKKLEAIYLNLKERADIEFAVVTVDTTGDMDIFDYSLAIYRGWGIGSKTNDGFLLAVAVKDRKYYTQVGYHLEGDLNDGLVGAIQREHLVPHFRRGNYNQGINDTVQAYVATLAQKRGFTIEGIDQRYAYREPTSRPEVRGKPVALSRSCCMLLIILGVVILILSSMKGGGRGGGGCLNLFLLGSLLNSGSSGWGGSRSGWGSGGFGGGGWGGGGGGFGGGGFGGGFGGGSAGGGGAGGSW